MLINKKMSQKQSAIKKTAKEKIYVDANCDEVVCDGGGGPLGHPKVWYSFDGRDTAYCFYCGREFIKKKS